MGFFGGTVVGLCDAAEARSAGERPQKVPLGTQQVTVPSFDLLLTFFLPFHQQRNLLRRALMHATQLKGLAAPDSGLCDARSEYEVAAYHAWLLGTLAFELTKWSVWVSLFIFIIIFLKKSIIFFSLSFISVICRDTAMPAFSEAKVIYSKLRETAPEQHQGIYTQVCPRVRMIPFPDAKKGGLIEIMFLNIALGRD